MNGQYKGPEFSPPDEYNLPAHRTVLVDALVNYIEALAWVHRFMDEDTRTAIRQSHLNRCRMLLKELQSFDVDSSLNNLIEPWPD